MSLKNKNTETALNVVAIVVGMFGLAYASVPLYDMFCKVTGFGGTPLKAVKPSEVVVNKNVNVLFSADVNPALPWQFKALQTSVNVKIGENKLVFFEAKNISDQGIIGTATYNVTPEVAAKYFVKIECFCFKKQKILPQQTVKFPVSFYIDPEILKDEELKDLQSITLSYTFFPFEK